MTAVDAAGGLPGPVELFSRATRLYRERWRTVFQIMALGLAATLASYFMAVVLGVVSLRLAPRAVWEALTLACVFGAVFSLLVFAWSQAAMIMAIMAPEPSPAAECLEASWSKTPGFIWVCALLLAASTGGLFLGVLPGILAAMTFGFAPFIQLTEGIGGLDALLKSAHYVRAQPWRVGGQLAVVSAAGSLPAVVPLAGPLLIQVLGLPFVCMSLAVLLCELRRLRGGEPFVPSWRGRLFFALCAAGLLVPAALLPRALAWFSYRLHAPGAGFGLPGLLPMSLPAPRGRA